MRSVNFKVVGMINQGCANVVERAIKEMGGVRCVTVSFSTQQATVDYDERVTSADKLRLAVTSAGYGTE